MTSTARSLKEYARRYVDSESPAWVRQYLSPEGLLLDVGCAGGALAAHVGHERYRGIDREQILVDHCVAKGLDVRQGSIAEIPFESGIFTCVYCSHVLEHVDVDAQYAGMRECFRLLKPRGRLVVRAPTPYYWYFYDDPTHVRPMTHTSLEIMARDVGFESVITFYSAARRLPRLLQRYLRIFPMPFLFWEVCLIADKDPAGASPNPPRPQGGLTAVRAAGGRRRSGTR